MPKGEAKEKIMDFKAGDVVKLKSGGPKMTIEKIGATSSANEENVAHCVWFDKDEQMKDGKFTLASLMLVPEK